MLTVDDLAGTREQMDRERFEREFAEDGPKMKKLVGEIVTNQPTQSFHYDMPAELRAPVTMAEISDMLIRRAELAYGQGNSHGWNRAWQEAERAREAELRAESSRWVEVALELVVREFEAPLEATEAAHAAAVKGLTNDDPVRGVTLAAHTELTLLRERLVALKEQIAVDGISA